MVSGSAMSWSIRRSKRSVTSTSPGSCLADKGGFCPASPTAVGPASGSFLLVVPGVRTSSGENLARAACPTRSSISSGILVLTVTSSMGTEGIAGTLSYRATFPIATQGPEAPPWPMQAPCRSEALGPLTLAHTPGHRRTDWTTNLLPPPAAKSP